MRDTELFQMALGLIPPWQVESCAFDPEKKRLDIMIDFPRDRTLSLSRDCQIFSTAFTE